MSTEHLTDAVEAAHLRRKLVENEGPSAASEETAAVSQAITQARTTPQATSPQSILRLQRAVGNRAVSQLVQTKLTVGPADDVYEREADSVADRVMASPATSAPTAQRQQEDELQAKRIQRHDDEEVQAKRIQRVEDEELQAKRIQRVEDEELQTKRIQRVEDEELQAKRIQRVEDEELQTKRIQRVEDEELQAKRIQRVEDEEVQAKRIQRVEDEELQAKRIQRVEDEELQTKRIQRVEDEEVQAKRIQRVASGAGFEAGEDVETRLGASRGGGQPLPDATRSFMEERIGADFSSVRVHTGGEASQLNRDLSAQAFTHGSDIYFGEGKYNPESSDGKHLLAHELTHTVQQGAAQAKKEETK